MCNPALNDKINRPIFDDIYLLILQNNYLFIFYATYNAYNTYLNFLCSTHFLLSWIRCPKDKYKHSKVEHLLLWRALINRRRQAFNSASDCNHHWQGESLDYNIVDMPLEMIINCRHTSWNEWQGSKNWGKALMRLTTSWRTKLPYHTLKHVSAIHVVSQFMADQCIRWWNQ